jgi:hypothetical protein
MKVLIPAPTTRTNSSQVTSLDEGISNWMRDNNVEHWLSYREDYKTWAVEFIGLNGKEDATAFKLAFGL